MCDSVHLSGVGLSSVLDRESIMDTLKENTSIHEVLQLLAQWVTQEFYLDCPERLFNTATDFVDVTSYNNPAHNLTASDFVQAFLLDLDSTNDNVQEILSNFQTYAPYFQFPLLTAVDIDSGTATLALRLQTPAWDTTMEDQVQNWLDNFYGDKQWGAYSQSLDGEVIQLTNPLYIENTLTQNHQWDIVWPGESVPLFTGFTIEVKLSFLMSLYQLIVESTKQGDFLTTSLLATLTPDEFTQIRVDESVPFPAQGRTSKNDFCASAEDCACTYFVVFRSLRTSSEMPLTTPAHDLYINRFLEPFCLCFVSRAVTLDADPVLNPFGLCFDQNCLSSENTVGDLGINCTDQCEEAADTLSGVNWQNNFVNPGAVNGDLVEQTCNVPVSAISSSNDRWRPVPLLLASAVCLFLAVPLYIGIQAWLQRAYRFSIWHVVFGLVSWGIGATGVYALSGQYTCTGGSSELDTQAHCVDRLMGIIPLSRECCDMANPVFCQCNPNSWSQQVCRSAVVTTFCKCQSNGLCTPTSGGTDVIASEPTLANVFNYQICLLCISVFVLVAPALTLGIQPALTAHYSTSATFVSTWIPSVWIHGLLIIGLFVWIVAFPITLTYVYSPERTFQVDTQVQNKVCSTDST